MEQAEDQAGTYTLAISGVLAAGRCLARPLTVVVEHDEGEVVVTEQRFHMHAAGSTEAEAIASFRRVFAGYLPFLERREDKLSARMREQLDYLRSMIIAAACTLDRAAALALMQENCPPGTPRQRR